MTLKELCLLNPNQIHALTPDYRKQVLGFLGERVVAKIHNTQHVALSPDQYDREKDMVINGQTVEVKTQKPWLLQDCFTVRPAQIPKCRGVDRLVFVDMDSSEIVETIPQSFKVFYKKTKSGLEMALIPRKQSCHWIIGHLTPRQLEIMRPFAMTEYPNYQPPTVEID